MDSASIVGDNSFANGSNGAVPAVSVAVGGSSGPTGSGSPPNSSSTLATGLGNASGSGVAPLSSSTTAAATSKHHGHGSTSGEIATSSTVATTTQKISRTFISVPRLHFEPVYTELKLAIGDHWSDYKQAVTLFLLGHYNQREFSNRVNFFLCTDAKLQHLHNKFICLMISNLTRDLPDQEIASWVSANDKLCAVSKPSSGDAAEQRLKTEVMQLQPKDRRRLKAIAEPDLNSIASELEEHHRLKQIRLPDQVPASAGGLNKTNWELEVRKRYTQALASEIGEFPDADTVHARMMPICYEESVVNGTSLPCAMYMSIATENFVKNFLSVVFSRTRENPPSGTLNATMTRRYRQQLEREEIAFSRGEVSKNNVNGLLPVEAKEASSRQGLGVADMRFALEMGGDLLGHMPLIVNSIMNAFVKEELDAEKLDFQASLSPHTLQNLPASSSSGSSTARPTAATGIPELTTEDMTGSDMEDAEYDEDIMEIDGPDARDVRENDYGEDMLSWEGATNEDHTQLGALLDECLSMAA